ncbi:hypothetical protein NKL07_22015 [Mesorhizobium sp. C280B]|uniref:hypothetical protein n=1 Tax=unclassified Mesorhizobium TaxID=325217 RepID=UPI0003CE8DDF|nr:hypothetical protein [Mesorhizobium sp. LSJC280B00]ESW92952.1 hypothetical protein X772_03115 [Mesorhizobium sp. LSJC280B00]
MFDSNLSEKPSKNSEFYSERRRRGALMTSVTAVQNLTRELGRMLAPSGGWQQQISAVHTKLVDPKFELAIKDLSWNRVKTWFYAEARRVDYDHMVALRELKAIEEAKRDHRDFIATTNRLAAALAAEGASLSRDQVEALARIASRPVDVPGDHDARSSGQVRGMADARASIGAGQ